MQFVEESAIIAFYDYVLSCAIIQFYDFRKSFCKKTFSKLNK